MSTVARLRAIERSVRPPGTFGEDPERARLLATNTHESFAPAWWPSAVRLAARDQSAAPETVDAAARGHPCARGAGPRWVVRAMLRVGPAWPGLSAAEQTAAVGAEEQLVFEREALAIIEAVARLGLGEFRRHDLRPALGEAAWTIGPVLRDLAAAGVLVQMGEDKFGVPIYRPGDDWRRGGPAPGATPPPSSERPAPRTGTRRREHVPVEA